MRAARIVRNTHGKHGLAIIIAWSIQARESITAEHGVFLALLVVHLPHDDLFVSIVPPAELDLAAWIGRSGEALHQIQRRNRKQCGIDSIVDERGPQRSLQAGVAYR